MNSAPTGTVSVLDARSGRLIRTSAAGPVPYAVAVDERAGRAFVLNANNGGVGVYDAASGRTFPSGMVVDERLGRTFVSSASGINILDDRTGRVLHTIRNLAPPTVCAHPRGDEPESFRRHHRCL